MGLDITKIKPRKVKIADKDAILVDSYRTFEGEIGDSPKEKITVCMLPLSSVDPVTDLHWLKKRNPQTDWKNLTFDLNRNGRCYMPWPLSPEEFIDGSPVTSCIPKDEKGKAIMKPVLRHVNIGESFITDPGSSEITIRVVIQQYFHNDGRPHLYPIVYMSKRFMEMESCYSIQEQLLAA